MSIARELGKLFMSPEITVDVCTIGGIDEDGNQIEEPTVFVGHYPEANEFFGDEKNLKKINQVFNNMPDGYIIVTAGNYFREVYDANEVMDAIEEMI